MADERYQLRCAGCKEYVYFAKAYWSDPKFLRGYGSEESLDMWLAYHMSCLGTDKEGVYYEVIGENHPDVHLTTEDSLYQGTLLDWANQE